jgi:hypothetical protein
MDPGDLNRPSPACSPRPIYSFPNQYHSFLFLSLTCGPHCQVLLPLAISTRKITACSNSPPPFNSLLLPVLIDALATPINILRLPLHFPPRILTQIAARLAEFLAGVRSDCHGNPLNSMSQRYPSSSLWSLPLSFTLAHLIKSLAHPILQPNNANIIGRRSPPPGALQSFLCDGAKLPGPRRAHDQTPLAMP